MPRFDLQLFGRVLGENAMLPVEVEQNQEKFSVLKKLHFKEHLKAFVIQTFVPLKMKPAIHHHAGQNGMLETGVTVP